MNRRSFLKSAGIALAAIALGIKTKMQKIMPGVKRGSPMLLDNQGISFKLELDGKRFTIVQLLNGDTCMIQEGYEHLSSLNK